MEREDIFPEDMPDKMKGQLRMDRDIYGNSYFEVYFLEDGTKKYKRIGPKNVIMEMENDGNTIQ